MCLCIYIFGMIIIAQRSMKNLTVPGLRQLLDLALLRSGCGGQHLEGGGVLVEHPHQSPKQFFLKIWDGQILFCFDFPLSLSLFQPWCSHGKRGLGEIPLSHRQFSAGGRNPVPQQLCFLHCYVEDPRSSLWALPGGTWMQGKGNPGIPNPQNPRDVILWVGRTSTVSSAWGSVFFFQLSDPKYGWSFAGEFSCCGSGFHPPMETVLHCFTAHTVRACSDMFSTATSFQHRRLLGGVCIMLYLLLWWWYAMFESISRRCLWIMTFLRTYLWPSSQGAKR